MIQKLKIKFVCLAMAALLVLLGAVVAGMNLINYASIVAEADETLEMLSQNKGAFPNFEHIGKKLPPHMSAETPYETRYFSVLLNGQGSIVQTDTMQIKAIDPNTAIQYAQDVILMEKNSGFYENFRFLHYREAHFSRIIFLDCTRKIQSFQDFLLSSICMALSGYVCFLGVILFFSGKFIKPVAESYEKQKRFITDAGHEIKTPLAIMKADAEVLEMEYGDNEWLEDLQAQIKQLSALTADLVYLARMEEAETSLPMIDFPFSDVVRETALSFQTLAQTQNKRIQCNVPELLSLSGNEKAIRQLINILMDNAIKYSPENGTICVTVKKMARYICLTVANSSREPLTQEHLEHLFDRFYRADSSRSSQTGGYGIGLSVAQAICSAHNAKISAYTKDGQTLEILIQFPV